MKPTAIVCGTAMLICYAILGTMYQISWFLAPIGLMGVSTLLVGLAKGKGKA